MCFDPMFDVNIVLDALGMDHSCVAMLVAYRIRLHASLATLAWMEIIVQGIFPPED